VRHALPLLVAASLAGCAGSTLGVDSRRVVGAVLDDAGSHHLRSLVAPDSARAGVPFTVRVTTFGSSSCTRADGAEVRVAGSVAEIVPFDRHAGGMRACTDDLASFPRDVAIRFDAAGPATVRVRGAALNGTPSVLERTVVVR